MSESTEGRYRISAIADRTGLPASTIRAWERRYGVPKPRRTNTAYRLFSDEDVRVLQRMQALCANGMTPSAAARQVTAELAQDAKQTQQSAAPTAPPEIGWHGVLSRLVQATRDFDPEAFDRAMRQAIVMGSGHDIYNEVFAPALRIIGDDWHAGRLSVAQEHMASERIGTTTRQLLTLAQPKSPRHTALLVCFADERHTLPLYGAAFRFTSWGFGVRLLGEGMPPSDCAQAVSGLAPDIVGLSITGAMGIDRVEALLKAYSGAFGDVPWLVGGAGVALLAPLIRAAGGLVSSGDWAIDRRTVEHAVAAKALSTTP